jgi:hypothetical protein
MLEAGLPDSRCEFHGKVQFGPSRVSVSIKDVIDEWNNHDLFGEDEVPRRLLSTNAVDSTSESSIPSSIPATTPQEWTEEHQEEFFGIYYWYF